MRVDEGISGEVGRVRVGQVGVVIEDTDILATKIKQSNTWF